MESYPTKYYCKVYIMLDAFPRSAGDHLAQNFSRKIKLISLTILH
jgi:hypothetical protein